MVLCFSSCGSDENPFVLVPYVRPDASADMSGARVPDEGSVWEDDPYFEDRQPCEADYVACSFSGGVGACVSGYCKLVACEEGRGDCDSDPTNGCEADLTIASSCGSCVTQCDELASCQQGDNGYVCSVGVVCPQGTYDLDDRSENGCELDSEVINSVEPQPVNSGVALMQRVDVLERGDDRSLQGMVVGFDTRGQQVASSYQFSSGDPLVVKDDGEPYDGNSLSLEMFEREDGVVGAFDAWGHGAYMYLHQADEQGIERLRVHRFEQEQCGSLFNGIRDGVVWDSSLLGQRYGVIGEHEYIDVRPCDEEALCVNEDMAFGAADYLRWFYPYEDDGALELRGTHADAMYRFSEQEVAQCVQCAVDLTTGSLREPRACFEPETCGLDFDADAQCDPVCGGTSVSCPDFSISRVVFSSESERFYVVTRRGVVVLRHDGQVWVPEARQEGMFYTDRIEGGQFIDAVVVRNGDVERLFLLHNQGFVRVVDVSLNSPVRIVPAHPDIPVSLGNLDGRGVIDFIARDAETFFLVDPYETLLVHLNGVDHKRYVIELEQDFSSGGFFGGLRLSDGSVALLRQEYGLLQSLYFR